jgi:hypothetical protein
MGARRGSGQAIHAAEVARMRGHPGVVGFTFPAFAARAPRSMLDLQKHCSRNQWSGVPGRGHRRRRRAAGFECRIEISRRVDARHRESGGCAGRFVPAASFVTGPPQTSSQQQTLNHPRPLHGDMNCAPEFSLKFPQRVFVQFVRAA